MIGVILLTVIILCVIVLNDILLNVSCLVSYPEYRCAECRYAKFIYVEYYIKSFILSVVYGQDQN
jgi:hypothetical protein